MPAARNPDPLLRVQQHLATDHRRPLQEPCRCRERARACLYSAVALVVSLPAGRVTGAGVGAGCGLRGKELDCRQP
jgi:hypothetical protein